jgi:hypothetical protein
VGGEGTPSTQVLNLGHGDDGNNDNLKVLLDELNPMVCVGESEIVHCMSRPHIRRTHDSLFGHDSI